MSMTKFRAWFPEYGETVDDANEIEAADHGDAAEEATDAYYSNSGPSIPSGGWDVAVLGPDEVEPRTFNVTIDWSPNFYATEKKAER